MFGTSCYCPYGNAVLKHSYNDPSNRSGVNLYVCPNSSGQPSNQWEYDALPRCSISCNKSVCIQAPNGRKTTGRIVSACPKYHPQNADQCAQYGGDYCTCIIRQTADLNQALVDNLGGSNVYATVWAGSCNGIEEVNTETVCEDIVISTRLMPTEPISQI